MIKDLFHKSYTKKRLLNGQHQAEKKDTERGNYYATQAAYLGEHYLKLVLGKHYQGRISLEQVADYLGVKPKNVAGLEEFAFQGATPA